MYKRSVRWAAVLAVLLVCAGTLTIPVAFAQETNAGVQGYVKDQTGAVMAGVGVEVVSKSMMGVRQTETDTAGFYRISGLPPGCRMYSNRQRPRVAVERRKSGADGARFCSGCR